jgi:hypothetical protein
MYAGALLWLVIIAAALVQLMMAFRGMNTAAGSDSSALSNWREREQITPTIAAEMAAQLSEHCALRGETLGRQREDSTNYGTVLVKLPEQHISGTALVELYIDAVYIMLLLGVAQWLFWSGFASGSSDEYVSSHTTYIYQLTRFRLYIPNIKIITIV